MDSIRLLVVIILTLAALLFIVGILKAINYSKQGTPSSMPQYLRQVVTSIGGVLATNLGAVLGIKVDQAKARGFDSAAFFVAIGSDTPSIIQLIAAYLYLIGLIIALYGWWKLKFTEDPNKVVITLPQLSQTFLGVIVGVLAVALGS